MKRTVPGAAPESFQEHRREVSGEGASLPLSPRRLRAKYTLRTNLRFMLRGFRPAGGKFAQTQIYTVRKNGLYLSMPPKGWAHGWRCCQRLHFGVNMQQHLRDFAEVPLRLSESNSREPPGYGHGSQLAVL